MSEFDHEEGKTLSPLPPADLKSPDSLEVSQESPLLPAEVRDPEQKIPLDDADVSKDDVEVDEEDADVSKDDVEVDEEDAAVTPDPKMVVHARNPNLSRIPGPAPKDWSTSRVDVYPDRTVHVPPPKTDDGGIS